MAPFLTYRARWHRGGDAGETTPGNGPAATVSGINTGALRNNAERNVTREETERAGEPHLKPATCLSFRWISLKIVLVRRVNALRTDDEISRGDTSHFPSVTRPAGK